VPGPTEHERTLQHIRKLCLALPETSERLSHGAPTFFVRGKRAFLMVLTNHHGDGRFAIWCAAPEGMQRMLVEADPERFFMPPTSATAGGSACGSTERSTERRSPNAGAGVPAPRPMTASRPPVGSEAG
jgi:hypothetical protein